MVCNIEHIIEVGCKNIDECPTPSAHARINEAHRMWHQTAANYDDPIAFRANLNACIQALRNVTFVLQKEKSRIPDFDNWYFIWQDILKKDNILKWLVDARNIIVKEGDLETQSRVKAAILSSYFGSPYYEMNVEPMTPTEDIAAMMASENIPKHLIKNGILRVERKWISTDFPEQELLDVLSHCYGVLSTMIFDAHSHSKAVVPQVFVRYKNGKVKQHKESITHLDGRLPCMVVEAATRTVLVKLSTNEFLKPKLVKVKNVSKKILIKRYGDVFANKSRPNNKREKAMIFLELAKTVLRTDGHHVPIVFLELKNNRYEIISFELGDQSEKYLMADKLARDVEKKGAKSVMGIAEAWAILPKNNNAPESGPVEEIPERHEALTVDYLSSDGDEFSFHCIFRREGDSIEFGDLIESPRSNNLFYTPLRKAWKRSRRLEFSKKKFSKYIIDRNAQCPCRSGKKYKKCCAPYIGTNLRDSADYLYSQRKYDEAEKAFRAFLTQYIKWYREHTVPFFQHNPQDADEILFVDINAIGEILYKIASCLLNQGRKDEIDSFFKRASDIIDDPRYKIVIDDLRKKF